MAAIEQVEDADAREWAGGGSPRNVSRSMPCWLRGYSPAPMTNNVHLSRLGSTSTISTRSVEFYTSVLGLQEKMKLDLGELREVMVAGDSDRASIL